MGWAIGAGNLAAPPGFETVAQRSFLASTGLLVAAGVIAVLVLVHRWLIGWLSGPVVVIVGIAWVGTAVAFASGLAEYGLAGRGGLGADPFDVGGRRARDPRSSTSSRHEA